LTAGSDEIIDLIGKAIDSKNMPHQETRVIAETIAKSIGERRPVKGGVKLYHCGGVKAGQ
jgi:hypothetical protein